MNKPFFPHIHLRKKPLHFLAATLTATLLSSGLITPVCNPLTVDAASSSDTTKPDDDWLHTEGSDIVDKDGKVVRLTGANWFGFNCSERLLHGLGWGADIRTVISDCADRGINLLRIPISTQLMLEWKDGKAEKAGNFSNSEYYQDNPDLVKSDGTPMNTLEVFDEMLSLCKEYGVKVMVDVHSAEANNSGHDYPLWYNTDAGITTQDWIDGWVWLVKRYKDDDTLIACDLENEPHGKRQDALMAKWDDSKDENNWRYAAQQCGEAILKENPNLLIMIEGVEVNPVKNGSYSDDMKTDTAGNCTNFEGAWWGGNLRMVKKYPLTFKDSSMNKQIVYSPHDYGPLVYAQTWFDKDFSEKSLLKDYWYDAWAYLTEENISPLLIGEWGGFMDGGDNEKWMRLLAGYMNKKNISHTFWCLNPNSGDTGGLLNDDWKSWDETKYALLKDTLFQDKNGTFVGLDHEKALGKNGMNLNQYDGKRVDSSCPPSSNAVSSAHSSDPDRDQPDSDNLVQPSSAPDQKKFSHVTLARRTITLEKNDTYNFTAYVTPTDASDTSLSFSSADSKIAVVTPEDDEKHTASVKAKKAGITEITVASKASPSITATLCVLVKPDQTTNLKKKKRNAKNITVHWKSVKHADGYQVFYKNMTTKKTYKKLQADETKQTLKLDKLDKNTTYEIKVRAYIKKKNRTVYGTYSSKIVVTTKP